MPSLYRVVGCCIYLHCQLHNLCGGRSVMKVLCSARMVWSVAQILGCSGFWQFTVLRVWISELKYTAIYQECSSGTVLLLVVHVPHGLWHSCAKICIHCHSVPLYYICSMWLSLPDIHFLDVMGLLHRVAPVSDWWNPILLPLFWLVLRLVSSSLSMDFVDCCLTCVTAKLWSCVAHLALCGLFILSNLNGLVECEIWAFLNALEVCLSGSMSNYNHILE